MIIIKHGTACLIDCLIMIILNNLCHTQIIHIFLAENMLYLLINA